MIAVRECGRFARAALARGPGEVCAVFRRSLYLRLPGGAYVCLGDATLGRGPLNARVVDPEALRGLKIGDAAAAGLRGARLWRPRDVGRRAAPSELRRNLQRLRHAATRHPAAQGLGGALVGARSPLLEHATPALRALDAWLARPREPVPARARRLIGLGPGLTPSGDDYFGGLLLGLRASGRRGAAAELWRWLEPRARRRTSAISFAHLAAAAQGEAHEALHACVAALFGAPPARWRRLLERLDAVGHSSGRDGLAGVVAVARHAAR